MKAATKRDREVDDEDELVGLCVGEYVGLKAAFTLGGGASMRVKHLRSYSLEELKGEVEKQGGKRMLVPPWLDANNLRRLLRHDESPAVAKKAKVAEVIPPVVFAADQGPEAFVAQIKGCAIEPIPWEGENDPGVCRMAVAEGMSWLTLRSRHLFVRSRYAELWDHIAAEFCIWKDTNVPNANQRVLLLGNTGIGKTAAINYFLRRALEAEYRVLVETRERRYYFHDGTVEWEELEASKLRSYRTDTSVLFFVDHQQDHSPPFCDAFTVAPVSPDPANYKEFKKNRCLRLWMPLTSREEILAMNTLEPRLGNDVILSRLDNFGPIPRLVFEKKGNQEAILADLAGKIDAFDFSRCRRSNMLHTGELPEEKDGLSWWILHVTTENLKVPSKMDWATPEIMHKVLQRYHGDRMKDLEAEIAELLNQPGALHAPAGEFQYWSCHMIASGTKVETFEPYYQANQCALRASPKKFFQLPQNDVVCVRTLAEVKNMIKQEGAVFYSQLSNEPLCDAAAVFNGELLLFQMTIGQSHGFKKQTFTHFCKSAKESNLTCVRFVFVVPHKRKFLVSKEQVILFEQDYGVAVALEIAEISPKA